MAKTTAEIALEKMERGELNPQEKVKVTLTRYEWANLLRSLEQPQPQPPVGVGLQLGRLAWMCIAHIQGRVAGVPEQDS